MHRGRAAARSARAARAPQRERVLFVDMLLCLFAVRHSLILVYVVISSICCMASSYLSFVLCQFLCFDGGGPLPHQQKAVPVKKSCVPVHGGKPERVSFKCSRGDAWHLVQKCRLRAHKVGPILVALG